MPAHHTHLPDGVDKVAPKLKLHEALKTTILQEMVCPPFVDEAHIYNVRLADYFSGGAFLVLLSKIATYHKQVKAMLDDFKATEKERARQHWNDIVDLACPVAADQAVLNRVQRVTGIKRLEVIEKVHQEAAQNNNYDILMRMRYPQNLSVKPEFYTRAVRGGIQFVLTFRQSWTVRPHDEIFRKSFYI